MLQSFSRRLSSHRSRSGLSAPSIGDGIVPRAENYGVSRTWDELQSDKCFIFRAKLRILSSFQFLPGPVSGARYETLSNCRLQSDC
jgi:hypothetical protein